MVAIKGHKVSEETRKKIGMANTIKMKELWKTPEYRQNMINKKTGKPSWNKGIKLPYEVWNKGKKENRNEVIDKMSVSHLGHIKPKNAYKFGKGEKHPNWLGGKSFEDYGKIFDNSLKFKIRARDNFTCQECGFTEEQLNKKLSVHHIDYNKKNNNSNNLISLCKSCHCQTNFKRQDWVVYFKEKVIINV